MRFAYADPPYFGCGARLYGDQHPEAAVWDSREEHAALIDRLLSEYPDGWALSCNPSDLWWYLPLLPSDVRVAAWCKTRHQVRPLVPVQYAWEPVIYYGGRKVRSNPMVRDWLSCPATRGRGVKGAKPDAFCLWVFRLLGAEPTDTLDDLFPGSGAVGAAWEQYQRQTDLFLYGSVNGAGTE